MSFTSTKIRPPVRVVHLGLSVFCLYIYVPRNLSANGKEILTDDNMVI